MKNFIFGALLLCILVGCKKDSKIKLKFLDEYVLTDSIQFKNTIIGGLSGVSYTNGKYYFVIDDARDPRFLIANILIKEDTFYSVNFKDVIHLKDSTELFYNENSLDLESIFVDESTNEIHFTSEGSIRNGRKPTVFKTDLSGNFITDYKLPVSFKNIHNIEHNAVFEASTKSFDKEGFWVAMEGVLKSDGAAPSFSSTSSPIRITYFDKKTNSATKQFAYELEPIYKPAKGNINLNGVTAILEYKENNFFIIERTYQNGYGFNGNSIRIFDASVSEKTTNIITTESLKETAFIPLEKKLILDFSDIKYNLTEEIIDNIEGITFGPKLSNGSKSLLLVSDDNFQVYGKQLNQLILLEITSK
tara:strand:- start:393 stop:1475 length:1083 start_codon:yes stop_codon:yes gene_type:complete